MSTPNAAPSAYRGYHYGLGHRVPAGAGGSLAYQAMRDVTVLNDFNTTFASTSAGRWDPTNSVFVGANVRRRRYSNLAGVLVGADLIETSRTNLFLQSQNLNTSWIKTDMTITTGAGVAPDGTSTLDLVTEGSAGTSLLGQSITVVANQAVCLSYYVRPGNATWFELQTVNGSDTMKAWFNLSTVTVGTTSVSGTASGVTAGIETVSAGLYRIWMGGVGSTTATSLPTRFFATNGDNSATRVNGSAYYVGWCQFEQFGVGTTTGYPSTYTATTTASVTRSFDNLFSSYVLGQTGTLLAAFTPRYWSGDQDGNTTYRLLEGDDTNITFMRRSSAVNMGYRRPDAAGTEGANVAHASAAGVLEHFAMTWDASAILCYLNGVQGGSDSSLTPPYNVNTKINIGSQIGGGASCSGYVAVLAWPRVLSAAELLAIRGAHAYA